MITRIVIVFVLALALVAPAFSQQTNYKDSIDVVNSPLGGIKFYQHGSRITMSRLTGILRSNPQAFAAIQKAKTNNTLAFIAGFAGGLLVGYELGNAAAGKKVNGAVIGIGAGIIGISIPFGIAGKRHAKRAVYLYNAAFR
jgi:hypothetical protein